jgi:glycosyltransferase involved in cell wall biosynthesis
LTLLSRTRSQYRNKEASVFRRFYDPHLNKNSCGQRVKIFLLTDFPSPYQVEVLNQIARDRDLSLQVGYLRRKDPARQWSSAQISHEFIALEDGPEQLATARQLACEADLAVFNYYLHPHAERLIWDRAVLQRPWCFWGERPGLRKPEWVGRLVRFWKLRWLHSSTAPIWGVGKFAVDRYRAEFGLTRKYFNLPYFSDLERFSTDSASRAAATSEPVFLFSGSLITRKGIDLLARAFVRLLREGYRARLKIIGEGELRGSLERTLERVSSSVEFMGFVDWKNLPSHYAASHVLCVPSRYDGWGLVVPEGLASGLPVIATDRMGAALEFIESGKNGWLIPADDEEAVFNAMREATLLSVSALTMLGRHAQESISDHSLQQGAIRFKQYSSETVANWHG